MEKKGTVTSLSSLFPAEEAQKAFRHVQDTITERQNQLHQLNSFITDNANLINLVHRLPNELHHDIMVPFGKAAFFPGQLIHTNEFMVLLGEGYYADRTSKQTTEILKRRGKALETQVESLKVIMQDLKAEASFFDSTASEASEGLVEIREDYVEEGSPIPLAKAGSKSPESVHILEVNDTKDATEDEEYLRIFSRMAELEKEEEQAEESHEYDETEQVQNELDISRTSQISVTQEHDSSQVEVSESPAVTESKKVLENYPVPKRVIIEKPLELPKISNKVQSPLTASNTAFTGSIVEHDPNLGKNSNKQHSSELAFTTGSIIEHAPNFGINSKE